MLDLAHSLHDGVLVLRPSGRLDAGTAADFTDRVEALAPTCASGRIVLDLEVLDYISSAGLRVVLAAAKAARAKGGGMTLCGLRGNVAQVMAVSGFDQVLGVHADVAAAVAAATA